jgi:hypothetical protein
VLRVEPSSCGRDLDPDGLPSFTQHGRAGAAGGNDEAALPVPGDRGPGFIHAARERGPLDELAGAALTSLRSVRSASARSSPRSPATPDAGPPKTTFVLAAARPPRQSLPKPGCGQLGGTALAKPPLLVRWRSSLRCFVAHDAGSPYAGRPTAIPPASPHAGARGTCGGIFERWAGKPAHCFGCRTPPIPRPLPVMEGASFQTPTPRPPSQAGARKSEREDRS